MTTEPPRPIPIHVGGKTKHIVWYRLPDPPESVTRWRLQVIYRSIRGHLRFIQRWLYTNTAQEKSDDEYKSVSKRF
jgi:hypothetical protein